MPFSLMVSVVETSTRDKAVGFARVEDSDAVDGSEVG